MDSVIQDKVRLRRMSRAFHRYRGEQCRKAVRIISRLQKRLNKFNAAMAKLRKRRQPHHERREDEIHETS